MSDLRSKRCFPCEGGVPALTPEQVVTFLKEVPEWFTDDDNKTIARAFTFADFQDAIVFINKVAKIAEEENHHPNMHLYNYSNVTISQTTHAIGGLSENDFILAAKIDDLAS